MGISRSLSLAAVALLASAALVRAQDVSQCPSGGIGSSNQAKQDVCQKTLDFFRFMGPQLGVSMTGGNTTLGQGGALGGLGHFAISVRGNALPTGGLPRLDKTTPSYTGASNATVETSDQLIGLPSADVAIGIFRGIPLGVTNVGGVDLLVSGFYVPEITTGGISLKVKDGNLKIGYGARIGIIQESALWPGVSVSLLKRDLPTMTLSATQSNTVSGNSTFTVQDFTLKTTAWRIAAAKSLLLFGAEAGFGQDKYESSANIAGSAAAPAPIGTQSFGPIAYSQSMTRNNMFVGASINLLIVKIVGEAGRVSGGTVNTYNKFGTQLADQARTYFSGGVRLGF